MLLAIDAYLPDECATERFGALLAQAMLSCSGASNKQARVTKPIGGRYYLAGDLGAGKTTLCRGLLRAFGHTGAVKSPTYTLVEPYEMSAFNIYHFDLYRLADPEEVEFLGVFDYFGEENICLIEWPNKGDGHVPSPDIVFELRVAGTGRQVFCNAHTVHGEKVLQCLNAMPALKTLGSV